METCRCCQEDISAGEEAQVVEPDGKATYFCVDCINKMMQYLISGEADQNKI